MNGVGSTGSLDSESSTVSGDGTSTISQETAINRDEQASASTAATVITSRHSRFVFLYHVIPY